MDETFFEQFVARFQAAWDRHEGEAFQTLWHPAGRLYYPPLGGWIPGNRIGELNELNSANLPDLTWKAESWAGRGSRLFVQMRSTATINGQRLEWTGVDHFTFRDELIVEEVAYLDTHVFWEVIDPAMKRGALMSLDREA